MFDIGFIELLVLGAAALILIGPERLPEVLRQLGLWIRALRRSIQDVQTSVEKELNAAEIIKPLQDSYESTHRIMEQSTEKLRSTPRIIVPESTRKDNTPDDRSPLS